MILKVEIATSRQYEHSAKPPLTCLCVSNIVVCVRLRKVHVDHFCRKVRLLHALNVVHMLLVLLRCDSL